MQALFSKTRDFNDDVFRNITSLRESIDLFKDLSDGDESASRMAAEAEMRVKSGISYGIINRGFHYTTSIAYPFESEPYLITRYSNGSFGSWYGSLDMRTTIYETAYHMVTEELRREGDRKIIVRERAVYLINCKAVLIDLTGKEKDYKDLISDDYNLTHQIGERLHNEGHPGLLAPSARCEGVNIVAFNPRILNNPRASCYLIYTCDPERRSVEVERQPGGIIDTITFKI